MHSAVAASASARTKPRARLSDLAKDPKRRRASTYRSTRLNSTRARPGASDQSPETRVQTAMSVSGTAANASASPKPAKGSLASAVRNMRAAARATAAAAVASGKKPPSSAPR